MGQVRDIKKGYVETTALKSTIAGHIYSVKSDTVLENGMAIKLGAMDTTTDLGVYNCTKAGMADKMVLMSTVVIMYDESTTEAQNECYYEIAVDEIGRCYEVAEGDRFAVSDYSITPIAVDVVKGNYVKVVDGQYVEILDSEDLSGLGFVGQIVDIQSRGILKVAKILVLKNEDVA